MKVLLTGGSGNLGQTLVPMLLDKGDTPVILDVRPPRDLKKEAVFIEGSILDRAKLTDIFSGCDCIVHIASVAARAGLSARLCGIVAPDDILVIRISGDFWTRV
jgi:nucleoside-diphosphate-sugar epimerase